MNDNLIINRVSIKRKGLETKTYLLPSITDILIEGSVKKEHIDWLSVKLYLDGLYESKSDHIADITNLLNQLVVLTIDELGNLNYNNQKFLNVTNYESPEQLESRIITLEGETNTLQSNINSINNTLAGLDDLYASINHNHNFLELNDISKKSCYIEVENNDTTEFIELLSDKLINLSAFSGPGGKVYITPRVRKGDKAILVAEPDSGYKFVNWTLNANEISTNAIHILDNILETALYQGHFTEDSGGESPTPKYNLIINEPNGGHISAKINGVGDELGYDSLITDLPLSTVITLKALPNTGYSFNLWTSGVPQQLTTLTETFISLNSNTTIAASFTKLQYSVTIGAAKDTNNTVLEGNHYPTVKIDNITQNNHLFNVTHGTVIDLDADTPINTNYYFAYWSDDSNQTNEHRTITINSPFDTYPIYEYRVPEIIYIEFGERLNGNWTRFDSALIAVKLNGNVIANPYNAGTYVNMDSDDLTVDGYQFVQWEDDEHHVIEEGGTLETDVNQGTKYYGTFVKLFNLTVTTNNSDYGTVTGSGTYTLGSTVTITANPNPHYHFVSWNDGNTTQSRAITVNTNATYTATFAIDTYTVSASVDPAGSGTVKVNNVNNSNNVTHGQSATLVATANSGYEFVNWTLNGNEVATTASYTIPAITATASYVAHFNADIYYYTSTNISDTSITGKEGTPITLSTTLQKNFITIPVGALSVKVLTIMVPTSIGEITIKLDGDIQSEATSDFTLTTEGDYLKYQLIAFGITGPYTLWPKVN